MSIAIVRATHICLRGSRIPTSKMSNCRPQWEKQGRIQSFSQFNLDSMARLFSYLVFFAIQPRLTSRLFNWYWFLRLLTSCTGPYVIRSMHFAFSVQILRVPRFFYSTYSYFILVILLFSYWRIGVNRSTSSLRILPMNTTVIYGIIPTEFLHTAGCFGQYI
jgi:hypothetical protein